jgi:hypothetical protein
LRRQRAAQRPSTLPRRPARGPRPTRSCTPWTGVAAAPRRTQLIAVRGQKKRVHNGSSGSGALPPLLRVLSLTFIRIRFRPDVPEAFGEAYQRRPVWPPRPHVCGRSLQLSVFGMRSPALCPDYCLWRLCAAPTIRYPTLPNSIPRADIAVVANHRRLFLLKRLRQLKVDLGMESFLAERGYPGAPIHLFPSSLPSNPHVLLPPNRLSHRSHGCSFSSHSLPLLVFHIRSQPWLTPTLADHAR